MPENEHQIRGDSASRAMQSIQGISARLHEIDDLLYDAAYELCGSRLNWGRVCRLTAELRNEVEGLNDLCVVAESGLGKEIEND